MSKKIYTIIFYLRLFRFLVPSIHFEAHLTVLNSYQVMLYSFSQTMLDFIVFLQGPADSKSYFIMRKIN